MLCATHTHSGPNTAGQSGWGDIDQDYCTKIFVPRILSAVEKAISNMQSVKMGVASGNSFVGINRRELSMENFIELGQNPWGPYNPEMTVLSFVDADENTVANLIHYAAHGTAAGENHEITRDWSGVMIDALEKQSGGITAFFNGYIVGILGFTGGQPFCGKTGQNICDIALGQGDLKTCQFNKRIIRVNHATVC